MFKPELFFHLINKKMRIKAANETYFSGVMLINNLVFLQDLNSVMILFKRFLTSKIKS